MGRVRIDVRFVSRRGFLERAGAALGVGAVAGCDTLVLPDGAGEDLDEIPPITDNDDFYVTSCCGTPSVDRDAWSMTITDETGGGDVPLATLDLAEVEALGGRDKEHTLQCIGSHPNNQAIGNAIWTGLPFAEILDALGVTAPDSAVEIRIEGADGYATSIPITDLDAPIWLVWRMNGEPLPDAHGATVRFLVPGRYGTKNPKWVTKVAFIDTPFVGYWEELGWSNTAEYRANGFIAQPDEGEQIAAGPVRLLGTAFAGDDPIERVEVSVDGGETWQDATITYANGPDVWTLWAFDWDATEGEHTLVVRVTTASGAMSDPAPLGTNLLEGYDGSMQVHVTVLA